MKFRAFFRLAACAALAIAAAMPAQADILDDAVSASLLPGWREADGTHVVGLQLELAPGWKTYWRAPGDAGIPPKFSVAGSGNVTGMRAHWPLPNAFEQNGVRSIGYTGAVVLPLMIQTRNHDRPIDLELEATVGVCRDICIPATLRFRAQLPASGTSNAAIKASLASRAKTAGEAGVQSVVCRIKPVSDGVRLTVETLMPPLDGRETVAVEADVPGIWISEPYATWKGNTLVTTTDLVPPSAEPFALDRSRIRVTVFGAGQAVDIRGCVGG